MPIVEVTIHSIKKKFFSRSEKVCFHGLCGMIFVVSFSAGGLVGTLGSKAVGLRIVLEAFECSAYGVFFSFGLCFQWMAWMCFCFLPHCKGFVRIGLIVSTLVIFLRNCF
jgi:hypothetical protein